MLIYMTVGILVPVLFMILPLKAIIGRERPKRITSVKRIFNMRDQEKQKAMPSGDTFAASFFVGLYTNIFGAHWLLWICVPLVGLGRVYVHCHWIGDTIVGGILGVIVQHYWCASPYF